MLIDPIQDYLLRISLVTRAIVVVLFCWWLLSAVSGVPGVEETGVQLEEEAGELGLAIIFWRTSRILSCRHT